MSKAITPELQRQRAGQAVQRRMAEMALASTKLAQLAMVSPNTVRALILGRRWPTAASRSAIEIALGWRLGELTRIAQGGDGLETNGLDRISDLDLVLELLRRVQRRE